MLAKRASSLAIQGSALIKCVRFGVAINHVGKGHEGKRGGGVSFDIMAVISLCMAKEAPGMGGVVVEV